MKIIKTNSEQLEIKESGVISVVAGIILVTAGLAFSVWVMVGKTQMPSWAIAIGLGGVVIGGLILYSAANRHVILRRTGESEVLVSKIVTKKQSRTTFQHDQIVSVNLETHTSYTQSDTDRTSQPRRERVSTLYMLLKDNSEIVLATARSGVNSTSISGVNLGSFGKAPLSGEATQIAAFYNVPFNAQSRGASGLQGIADVIENVKQSTSVSTPFVQPQSAPPAPVVQPSVVEPRVDVAAVGQPVISVPQQAADTPIVMQNTTQEYMSVPIPPIVVASQPQTEALKQTRSLNIPQR